jgi:zinc/manganese transport system substrate-binding protein
MLRNLFIALALSVFALGATVPAFALEVFACEPEWAALVKELAGDDTVITTATTAFQDPHYVQAKPSLIASTRSADLVVCSGADLEVGWLPLLLRRSGNAKVQPGNPGYFLAADHVRRLEVPEAVDRSMGDVHPQGNPHVHLSPRNITRIAQALTDTLTAIDPANAGRYRDASADFTARWDAARERWEADAAKLAGLRIVTHHTSFSYLADWLDLDVVATMEPKPGVPPSGAQLARLLDQLEPAPPVAIVRAPFENERPSQWLSERLHVPVVVLPYTVDGDDAATDLFSLFDDTLQQLAEIAR